MAKIRKKRTDKELVDVSEHLLYEIQMLFGTAQAMGTLDLEGENDVRRWAIRNALVESFTVHARILLDFLFSTEPKPDDVIAEDFFDNGSTWLQYRPAKTQLLATIHKRVGKEVAHLTYARLAVIPEAKQWHFVNIANQISAVLEKFLRLVPASRGSDSFRRFISQIIGAEGRANV
jgi:hypothetical protein